jgi:NAD(P)-dependent dehydrogenase (short-subunit alcohol dehydrogenase family)
MTQTQASTQDSTQAAAQPPARTILITGASSGFGKATAEHFLQNGWNVVATMRKPDRTLFPASERLRVVALDVTDAASIERALDEGAAAFGRIDAVVNNAGIGLLSAVEFTPDAVVREVFETNTFGVMSVCRAALSRLRQQGGGSIINVTSNAGITPMPLVAVYCASKCAIEGYSESLAYEAGLVGVRVRIVEPGLAPDTRFAANGMPRMEGLTPPPYADYTQAYFAKMQNYPAPYSTAADIAEAVYAAVTDDGEQLRYPAGQDARYFTNLRWSGSEAGYLAKMRELFGP